MTKTGGEGHGTFWIVVDNTRVAYTHATDTDSTYDGGRMTIILELTAGQAVQVESNVSSEILGTDLYGVMYSWFSGYLLFGL